MSLEWRLPQQKDLDVLKSQASNLPYLLRSKGNIKDSNGLWEHKHCAFVEQQDLLGFNALPSGQLLTLKAAGLVEFVGIRTRASWWTRSKGKNATELQQCWTLSQNYGGMLWEIGKTTPLYSRHYAGCIKKS